MGADAGQATSPPPQTSKEKQDLAPAIAGRHVVPGYLFQSYFSTMHPTEVTRKQEFKVRLIEKIREARFVYDKDHADYWNMEMKNEWFEQTGRELGFRKYQKL